MRSIDREFDILGLRPCNLADHLTGGRRNIVEISALYRGHPFTADEVFIASAQWNLALDGLEVGSERAAFGHGTAVGRTRSNLCTHIVSPACGLDSIRIAGQFLPSQRRRRVDILDAVNRKHLFIEP